jgi:hypothetical protein
MPEMTFIQIDLETLAKNALSPILSMGAVAYTRRSGIFQRFEACFNLDEQFRAGRLPDGDTIMWWMKQSDEARAALYSKERQYKWVVHASFIDWFAHVQTAPECDDGKEVYVMGNGNDFDIAILDSLFEANVPWHYQKKMCWRTIANLYKDELEYPEKSVRHSALADAEAQALTHLKLLDKHPERLSLIKEKKK